VTGGTPFGESKRVGIRRAKSSTISIRLSTIRPIIFYKADNLYSFFFDEANHHKLHDALGKLGQHWLLSYDAAKPIIEMYQHNGIGPKRVELLYSAANSGKLTEMQELLVTGLPKLPRANRLWRTADEWKIVR
jgi:hypothetical protein